VSKIATRKKGEEHALSYRGAYINTGVRLVAGTETYREVGVGAYRRWIARDFELGADRVYIVARGAHIDIAREVRDDAIAILGIKSSTERKIKCILDDGPEMICFSSSMLGLSENPYLDLVFGCARQTYDFSQWVPLPLTPAD
jgi:hypothetical protein